MKRRVAPPRIGIYQDFRAVLDVQEADPDRLLRAAKDAGVRVVASSRTEMREGVLFLSDAGEGSTLPQFPEAPAANRPAPDSSRERRRVESQFKRYPDEVYAVAGGAVLTARGDGHLAVALRNTSHHILARELTDSGIHESLAEGHVYLAHDWLCDPTGFSFIAQNALGAFEIGDTAPILGETRLEAILPVPAKIKLLRNGAVIATANDSKIAFDAKEEGDYRLAAWLNVAGEDRPWIFSNPIRIRNVFRLEPPPRALAPNVEVHSGITYTEGPPGDAVKHKLDLYLPKDKTNFPVMIFLHGGSWRWGDRGQYPALGNRFAKAGIGVVIPSYRLMPEHPHPAQIEDVAAAFAWVYRNIAQHGGDVKRIYVVGHSAGAHLASLLALDNDYLKRYDIPPEAIRGVAAMSGLYDLSPLPVFQPVNGRRDGSPLHYVHSQAPAFLITFCQWDYPGLPKQARDFEAALRKAFVAAKLIYIAGQSHMSEVLNIWKDDDPLALAILDFVQ